jgi:hypothetical protein
MMSGQQQQQLIEQLKDLFIPEMANMIYEYVETPFSFSNKLSLCNCGNERESYYDYCFDCFLVWSGEKEPENESRLEDSDSD